MECEWIPRCFIVIMLSYISHYMCTECWTTRPEGRRGRTSVPGRGEAGPTWCCPPGDNALQVVTRRDRLISGGNRVFGRALRQIWPGRSSFGHKRVALMVRLRVDPRLVPQDQNKRHSFPGVRLLILIKLFFPRGMKPKTVFLNITRDGDIDI